MPQSHAVPRVPGEIRACQTVLQVMAKMVRNIFENDNVADYLESIKGDEDVLALLIQEGQPASVSTSADRERASLVGTAASHLSGLLVYAANGGTDPQRERIFHFLTAILSATKAQTEDVVAEVTGENKRVKGDLAKAVDTIAELRSQAVHDLQVMAVDKKALVDARATIADIRKQVDALSLTARKLAVRTEHDKNCDARWGSRSAGKVHECNCGLSLARSELERLAPYPHRTGLKMWTASRVFLNRPIPPVIVNDKHHPNCVTVQPAHGQAVCDCGVDAAETANDEENNVYGR